MQDTFENQIQYLIENADLFVAELTDAMPELREGERLETREELLYVATVLLASAQAMGIDQYTISDEKFMEAYCRTLHSYHQNPTNRVVSVRVQ